MKADSAVHWNAALRKPTQSMPNLLLVAANEMFIQVQTDAMPHAAQLGYDLQTALTKRIVGVRIQLKEKIGANAHLSSDAAQPQCAARRNVDVVSQIELPLIIPRPAVKATELITS